MPIKTAEVLAGARGRILALGSANRFPLLDFFEECECHYPAEVAKLNKLFERLAATALIRDETKCRKLHDDLYELKTSGGLRVTWFWDEGYTVLCGHCFVKKSAKTPKNELQQALEWQRRYRAAKQSGQIQTI